MNKALVLLSGGLDSSVLLAKVVNMYGKDNVVALNIYYGQKHEKEQICANKQAEIHGVTLHSVDLSEVFKFDLSCPLLKDSKEEMPLQSYAEQLAELGGDGTVKTYVPFRNGLFLSYAAAVALQLQCNEIHYGAHADDAVGHAYPDCAVEFISAMKDSIYFGTGGKVIMYSPFWDKTKADVVCIGLKEKVSFENTWSCYVGREQACGVCGTCIDRKAAFIACGKFDPIEYEGDYVEEDIDDGDIEEESAE